ncbi:MAG: 3-hydroxybutyryl-CoA dehydrogenase [Chloroflexi bacterium]|nr:3-hydroxybutyryl-CoA dehydrogenase [Chloroflexota bacterium]
MTIQPVGVIGAGLMGIGLAQALAQTDHTVVLIDVGAEQLRAAESRIRANLRLHRLLNATARHDRGSSRDVLDRIRFTTDYNMLRDVSYVIENITEQLALKRQVYLLLSEICPEQCIFAANTSAIPITRIGALTNRPSRVVGMHFMNPVPLKDFVEVIRGYHTSDETLQVATQLLGEMHKEWTIVSDAPGFVSNRILMPMINEAAFLVQEGVATPEQIDKVFKACLGHPMGPLETADLIGLDTILYSVEVLFDSFKDSKYRPCPLLQKMVDAGLLGSKSGKGFYSYARPE